MEIKVQCDCGQKFKFDVEPVNGRMPWEVQCPVCGASGTAKANDVLQKQLGSSPPPPPPVPVARVIPTAAAVPAAPAPMARLSIARPQPAPAAAEAVPVPPPVAPAVPRPVPRRVSVGARPAKSAGPDAEGKTPNFWLSTAAVFLGAVIGLVLWHVGYRLTGWSLGFMALVTGCIAGAAPQVLGHYRGVGMGFIAAFLTFVAVFTAQFLNAKHEVKSYVKESTQEEYDDAMKEAKAAVEAVPNGTDQEIRAHLAKDQSFEGFVVSPSDIDQEEVNDLRRQLPLMRELVNGQIKPEEYQARAAEQVDTGMYESAVTEAKAVVAVAPNGTEQELRAYLAKEYSEPGATVTPAEIDADEVEYLQQQYPRMKQLADGSLTREQYLQQESESGLQLDEEDFLNFYLIFRTVNIFNIVSIVLGIGAAFLTAKG